MAKLRFGVDLGGTKIELLALSSDGQEVFRERVATPQGDYEGTLCNRRPGPSGGRQTGLKRDARDWRAWGGIEAYRSPQEFKFPLP